MKPSIFTDMGLKLIKELQKNERFATMLLADEEGERVIGKVAIGDFVREIENEIWWNLTLKRLREADHTIRVRAPIVHEYGPGWYISEYFDAAKLIEREDVSPETIGPHLDLLTEVLLSFDRLDMPRTKQKMNLVDVFQLKIDKWRKVPEASYLITEKRLNKARSILEKHQVWTTSLQHGDLVPWHMFRLGEEVGLIDGEHASLRKPRYYDLAYMYARIFTRMRAKGEAQKLLSGFLKGCSENEANFSDNLLPELLLRAFGMLPDSYIHNSFGADLKSYISEVEDLIDRCLAEDLSKLLS